MHVDMEYLLLAGIFDAILDASIMNMSKKFEVNFTFATRHVT